MNEYDIDKSIREALSSEDAELNAHFSEEPSLPEMMIETFRGRQWFVSTMGFIMMLIFLGLCIFCGWKLLQVDDTVEALRWAAGFLFCMTAVSIMKIWYWLEMVKNSMVREVKRLELQVARLSQRVGNAD